MRSDHTRESAIINRRRQATLRASGPARLRAALLVLLACAGCTVTPDSVGPSTPGRDRAVVFDIDGTLTPTIAGIHAVRDGAADAVNAWAVAGCEIVYLTGRHPLLQFRIPGWLERHGFPDGKLHVMESASEQRDPAAFKQRIMERYRERGWNLVAAYGDTSTDFQAYAAAGIPGERVFALLRVSDAACEPGPWLSCHGGWPEQATIIADLAAAQC